MKKFSNEYLNCIVTPDKILKTITVQGNILNPGAYKLMVLLGANPPDSLSNYSGNALPFPCFDIAFDNTINKYMIPSTGYFNVTFKYPNSYYKSDGRTKVISPIVFLLDDNNITFELNDKCKLKTLTNRGSDVYFYSKKESILPIDTAENVMYAYADAKINYNLA